MKLSKEETEFLNQLSQEANAMGFEGVNLAKYVKGLPESKPLPETIEIEYTDGTKETLRTR